MTRLMALDVGEARIGVAISDATQFLASPYTTLHVSRNEAQTWEAIQHLIDETEAGTLVVGLPISLDGQLHAQGERVQAFAERLREHIAIPITFWDERLSTVEAERLLMGSKQHQGGQNSHGGHGSRGHSGQGGQRRPRKKRRRNEQEIDALAATVILQEYLDNQRSTTGEQLS